MKTKLSYQIDPKWKLHRKSADSLPEQILKQVKNFHFFIPREQKSANAHHPYVGN